MFPEFENGIYGFDGEFGFLSNFYVSPLVYDNILYPSAEHAYQAAKCLDRDTRVDFASLTTPAQAKRAGRLLNIRADWEQVKIQVMRDVLAAKFMCPELRQKMINTGERYLEETNWWGDTFWGVCKGKGKNVLGMLLMELRTNLLAEDFFSDK